ncbi:MAG: hypothetical protein ACKVY0_14510 [Prosthecobacter sp.]|uniref:hypothetical protein n=1 Tax=Prosthecobacter sp. TaxID=1965333 RepID=UPI0039006981
MSIFLGELRRFIMMSKGGEDAREIIFQQKTNEAEESQQEYGSEGKADEIRSARRTQAGDVAAGRNRRGGHFMSERTTQAE